ncbi:unnamed protein product [Auanema sp. JU1783]|nr:unnamed protein product [Auanema sp. JU1783]
MEPNDQAEFPLETTSSHTFGQENTNQMTAMDMINVPVRVAVQLEKMSEVMRLQTKELDRLTGINSQLKIEKEKLKVDLEQIHVEYKFACDKLMENDSLLSSVNAELTSLLRERHGMHEKILQLERKYQQAKAASLEFSRVLELEHELFPTRSSLDKEMMDHAVRAPAAPPDLNTFEEEKQHLLRDYEGVLKEKENLKQKLEKECNYSKELLLDLERNRTMLLDREEEIIDLKKRLADSELAAKQNLEQLSCTQSDLQMERGRCDWLTLALTDNEVLIAQNRNESMLYMEENSRLANDLKAANVTIISLKAKLEAQGRDLLNTRKALIGLQDGVAH